MEEPHQSSPHQRELVLAEARRLEWVRGLSEEALAELSEAAELVHFQPGQAVSTIEDGVTSVYFIVTGRLRVIVKDALGRDATQEWLTRGRVLGLFTIGLTDHSQLQAEAVEPSSALRMRLPELLSLSRHAEFQLALLGLASDVVKRVFSVERTLPKPKVVGVIHQSQASRTLTVRLAQRLSNLGEAIAVAGDQREMQTPLDVPYRQIIRGDDMIDLQARTELLKEWSDKSRLLIDVSVKHGLAPLKRLLSFADIVLWCLHPDDVEPAGRAMRTLEQDVPDWRDDIYVVWTLDNEAPVPPYASTLYDSCAGDFKVSLEEPAAGQAKLLWFGIERIVHHLRGIKIGLALGGGAARGMAHLGVLKALEDQGICVDMIAGTSAGAMTGTIYSAGLDPAYAVDCFKTDLRPSWFFRRLPAGGYWYLLAQYRFNRFDAMLRKYLSHYQAEQLVLPMLTVSVDLVEGIPLIRDEGDATHNILESINLPPLALPIIRSQQAVVDGGLLNNVPADILAERGCNFIIASTVTAKLEKDFLNIRSRGRHRSGWLFPSIKVAMRQSLIQSHSMNSVGVGPADFVISPDVTAFDLSEFTRADEMADIGEATTNKSVARLRELLSHLDPQLFGPGSKS